MSTRQRQQTLGNLFPLLFPFRSIHRVICLDKSRIVVAITALALMLWKWSKFFFRSNRSRIKVKERKQNKVHITTPNKRDHDDDARREMVRGENQLDP